MIWGSAATGLVFAVLAWVVLKHHPNIQRVNWEWVHAFLMLLAGIGFAALIAQALHYGLAKLTDLATHAHGPGWLLTGAHAATTALPWCIGLALVAITIFHMAPKWGSGIRRYTPWVAFLAPAALGLFPPLFSLIGA
jgi:hypothetical protein